MKYFAFILVSILELFRFLSTSIMGRAFFILPHCPPEFSILRLSVCALFWFLSCPVYSYSKTGLVSCCLLISFGAMDNAVVFPYLTCKRWEMQNSATRTNKITEHAELHPSYRHPKGFKKAHVFCVTCSSVPDLGGFSVSQINPCTMHTFLSNMEGTCNKN